MGIRTINEKEMKMSQGSINGSEINWMLGGIALGALIMFLLDPSKGRRRRALARDKMHSATLKAHKRIDAKSRDIANRAKGLRAKASHILS
jgi:hypothetical protein